MPDINLDDLEAKARAATPGWRRQGTAEKHHVFIQHDHGIAPELGRVLLRMNEHFPYEADAAFVAACSPDVVLALVGRVRELESRLAALQWWKPEEAPAPQTTCLLALRNGRLCVGTYSGAPGAWAPKGTFGSPMSDILGWLPLDALPEPPKGEADG